MPPRFTDDHSPPVGPHFACVSAEVGGALRVSVSGELDLATAPRLEHVLDRSRPGQVVVLDLRRLEFIDSSGARLLLGCDRRLREQGGRLLVVRGAEMVALFFQLTGLDHRLETIERPPARAAAGEPHAAGETVGRQPDEVPARLRTSKHRLEAVTGQRDELRAQARCLEQELLDLVFQPPARIGPPPVRADEPA